MTRGRPTDYSSEIADEICSAIANGLNLNKIAAMENMPARSAIYRWLSDYQDFKDKYTRARETRADWRFDKIDDVILDMRQGIIDSNQARVEIDAIKWQAGKENSKNYGDKQQIDHSGTMTLSQLVESSFKSQESKD